MKTWLRSHFLALCILALGLTAGGMAYAETAAAPAQPAAAPAPVPPATAELREAAAKAPTPADLAKGDPGGTITGSIADVTVTDAKAGPTLADAGNQIGQNKIAINFVWTLICGFLVMFMQAGFAMVESGLTRVKNANHTYMMNFFVYGCGLLAYWVLGFAIQQSGSTAAEHDAKLTAAFHELDPSRYPATVAVADDLPVPLEEEFAYGLRLIIAGLDRLGH